MRDFSEDDHSNADYLKKRLHQGRLLIQAIKARKLQSELKSIKFHTQTNISSQTQKLTKFSWQKSTRQRGAGIMLSWGLAGRNVTRSKYRSFLLIFGIMLTVALETGIVISVDTLYDDFVFDHRNQNFTDITVHPINWQNLANMTQMAQKVAKTPGVVRASPVYYANIDNLFGQAVKKSNILIYGIDSKTHPDFRRINITLGERSLKNNRMIISDTLYDQGGLTIGESVNLNDLGPEYKSQEITLGGVMDDEPFFGNKIGYAFILLDIELLYNIVYENQLISLLSSEIDVEITSIVDIKKISENIKDAVGLNYYVFSEKDISEIEASGIRAYQTAMNLVIMASFVVEFLFITNVLAISIRDRSKEFGIIRAIGGKAYQLIESVTYEILIYSAIGCTIGVGVGIALSSVLTGVMDDYYVGLEFQQLSIHTTSLIVTYLSGALVALISGLYPIFLAISMPVVQNIHSRMRSGSSFDTLTNSWKYTVGTGFLLALVGFILQYYVGPSRFLDFEILSLHFVAVLMIFIGTVLLEMGILVFLPKIAMKLLIGFSFITRTISTRNIAREFQKSLFTIMTSAMALTFIIVVGLISAAVISGVPAYYENQWGAIDLVAETRDAEPLPTDTTNRIDGMSGVIISSFIQEVRTELDNVSSYVYGVDPFKYVYFSEPPVDSLSSFEPYELLSQSNVNRTNGVISHILYQKLRVPLGSNISLKIATNSTVNNSIVKNSTVGNSTVKIRTVNVTLTAVVKANIFLGNGEYLYIPSAQFREFFNSTVAKWFLCDVEDDEVQRVKRNLEFNFPEFKEEGVISITFFTDMMRESLIFQSAIFQVLFFESFILAAIAQFVCILVSTLRMEREIGIMRSLGLNRRGVFGIFMTESIALGISALFVGLFDGILGAVLLADYISASIPIFVSFPATSLIIWMSISFLITILSTLLPSYRSSRKNVVATISGRPMVKGYVDKDPYRLRSELRAVESPWLTSYGSSNPTNPFMHYSDDPLSESSRVGRRQNQVSSAISQSSILRFIRNNILPIQTIFLLLMAIITFNYILDENIIMRGLNIFDTFIRFTMSLTEYIDPQYQVTFLNINPVLVIVGLAAITPVAHYLTYKQGPESLLISVLGSLFWAFLGLIVIIFSMLATASLVMIILIPVQERIGDFSTPNTEVLLEFSKLGSLLLVGVFFFYLFQKFWCFMTVRGIEPELSYRGHLTLVKTYGSGGSMGFMFLLLGHILLQTVLYSIAGPFSLSDPIYPDLSTIPPIGPIEFLVYSIYEVGYYLLLIIYTIVHFGKSVNLVRSGSVQYKPVKVQIPAQIIVKSQELANKILSDNVKGISLNKKGIQLFSEVINGQKLLFFQEDDSKIPVAMNYALHFPKEYVPLSEEHPTQIKVPNAEQIERFVHLMQDFEFREDVTP
jgi:putative ABC transport system permease protein